MFLKYVILIFPLFLLSCGYNLVSGKGIYGGEILSIEIPIFKNMTEEPHIGGYVTDAFSREIFSSGLLEIGKRKDSALLEGKITKLRITHEAFGKTGIVTQKRIDLSLSLSLIKDGKPIKTWNMSDSQSYLVEDKNLEDYNKREAIKRLSERMARRFLTLLMREY